MRHFNLFDIRRAEFYDYCAWEYHSSICTIYYKCDIQQKGVRLNFQYSMAIYKWYYNALCFEAVLKQGERINTINGVQLINMVRTMKTFPSPMRTCDLMKL